MDSMLKIGFTDLFEPQQMGFEPFLKKGVKKKGFPGIFNVLFFSLMDLT